MKKIILITLLFVILFFVGCKPKYETQIFNEKSLEQNFYDDKTRLSCEHDSECVWAVNPHECCICPAIYNRKIVDEDKNLVIDNPKENYSNYTKIEDCSTVVCAPCIEPGELECEDNACKLNKLCYYYVPMACIPEKVGGCGMGWYIASRKNPVHCEKDEDCLLVASKLVQIKKWTIDEVSCQAPRIGERSIMW